MIARRLRDGVTHPRLVEPAPTDRVLVLAPHMDDEAIGCGGAVLRHRQAGSPVAVVYLTDGAQGDARLADPSIGSEQAARLSAALRVRRRQEAEAWCTATGIERMHFLDLPDGRLEAHIGGNAVGRLADIFATWRPNLVYLPSPLDVHADHRAANRLALAALRRAGLQSRVLLRGYEVWTPVLANVVMDISAVANTKAELLRLHASQLRDIDYARHILALNAYRSLWLPGHEGHAEAFVELGPGPYAALLAPISGQA
jgi:LmbE family N-acetylglucosaminyl deacetylase